jgi:small subunit ribosomal protein S8
MSADTIADMLSTIKNAFSVRKPFVEVPYSKQKEQIAKVLEERGFISKVKVFSEKNSPIKGLHIDLAYTDDLSTIKDLRRVSKPGRRIYKEALDLNYVKSGHGILVVSTSRGIMSGEEARKKKLGGEVLCEVW